jgi:hypothetical protein
MEAQAAALRNVVERQGGEVAALRAAAAAAEAQSTAAKVELAQVRGGDCLAARAVLDVYCEQCIQPLLGWYPESADGMPLIAYELVFTCSAYKSQQLHHKCVMLLCNLCNGSTYCSAHAVAVAQPYKPPIGSYSGYPLLVECSS